MDTLHAAMSFPDPPPSRDVLERARAYVRVDRRVVAALPELGEATRSFEPVPGPAGESVAEWLAERALSEPQEATVRVRLSHGKLAGVYALCAAQVALSREERAQLGRVRTVRPGSARRCFSTPTESRNARCATSARPCW
jgi:hypothetical protein